MLHDYKREILVAVLQYQNCQYLIIRHPRPPSSCQNSLRGLVGLLLIDTACMIFTFKTDTGKPCALQDLSYPMGIRLPFMECAELKRTGTTLKVAYVSVFIDTE